MLHVAGIDMGHGGPDPGAVGSTGLREALVNWEVGRRVEQYLAREGLRVVLSRGRDENPAQSTRRDRLLAAGAELIVSIHHNSAEDPTARGMEAFVYAQERMADAGPLAWFLLRRLRVATNRTSRGIKTGRYTVCSAPVPSVLVEPAFLSNPEEEQLLREPWFWEKEALAIAEAIRRFMLE